MTWASDTVVEKVMVSRISLAGHKNGISFETRMKSSSLALILPWVNALMEVTQATKVTDVEELEGDAGDDWLPLDSSSLSGDTHFRPSPSCSAATHRSLMSDLHCASFSHVGAHRTHHGFYCVTSHLHIYHVPMFLDLTYI